MNISGNLTRDPELRVTGAGTSILSFGVAVNDRRRNPQSGEWRTTPTSSTASSSAPAPNRSPRFLSKGSKVAVEGKLRYSSWETKDGQKRSKLEVVVDEVEFLSSRSQQGGALAFQQDAPSYAAPAAAPQPNYAAPVQTPPSAEVYDEDIPF